MSVYRHEDLILIGYRLEFHTKLNCNLGPEAAYLVLSRSS